MSLEVKDSGDMCYLCFSTVHSYAQILRITYLVIAIIVMGVRSRTRIDRKELSSKRRQ